MNTDELRAIKQEWQDVLRDHNDKPTPRVLRIWTALGQAAGEIDRLRKVIEDAPHGPNCAFDALSIDPWCICWKADAL